MDHSTNTWLAACPADSALGKTITVDFTQGESSEFAVADGSTITYGTNGAEFIITSDGTARTITSNNYIFFGKVEIVMRAANGTGIVSSFVMESDDLDEIDWVRITSWSVGALTDERRSGSAEMLRLLRPTISVKATPPPIIVQPTLR